MAVISILLVRDVNPYRRLAAESDVEGIRALAAEDFKRAHAVSLDRHTRPCADLAGAACVNLGATGCTFRNREGGDYEVRF